MLHLACGPSILPHPDPLPKYSVHKYDHVCCIDFRFWRGATREHPRSGAVTEEQRSRTEKRCNPLGGGAFRPDVVARFFQTLKGMRVARASSGPKIPRRKRGRSYETVY